MSTPSWSLRSFVRKPDVMTGFLLPGRIGRGWCRNLPGAFGGKRFGYDSSSSWRVFLPGFPSTMSFGWQAW
jgi:hypothetical protein